MYLNKRTKKTLGDAVLALKVHAKRHGMTEHGTQEWHDSWDDAQACHYAIQIMIGDDTLPPTRGLRALAVQGRSRCDGYTQADRWLAVLGLPVADSEAR